MIVRSEQACIMRESERPSTKGQYAREPSPFSFWSVCHTGWFQLPLEALPLLRRRRVDGFDQALAQCVLVDGGFEMGAMHGEVLRRQQRQRRGVVP
jgi:hypothetical protein